MRRFRARFALTCLFLSVACATAPNDGITTNNSNEPQDDGGESTGNDGGSAPKPDHHAPPPDGTTMEDTGVYGLDTGSGNDGKDTGSTTMDVQGGGCTLPAGAQSGSSACDQCMGTSCCSLIGACFADSACAAIYACTQACDLGHMPGGSTFDAASTTDMDTCWNQCSAGSATTAKTAFDAQDNCVSTSCSSQCLL